MEKKCPACGKVFKTYRKEKKFCSPACRCASRKTNKERICPICLQTFRTKTSTQKYCSNECVLQAIAQKKAFLSFGLTVDPWVTGQLPAEVLCNALV